MNILDILKEKLVDRFVTVTNLNSSVYGLVVDVEITDSNFYIISFSNDNSVLANHESKIELNVEYYDE